MGLFYLDQRLFEKSKIINILAVRNRVYTSETHLRGFENLNFLLVHAGGLCFWALLNWGMKLKNQKKMKLLPSAPGAPLREKKSYLHSPTPVSVVAISNRRKLLKHPLIDEILDPQLLKNYATGLITALDIIKNGFTRNVYHLLFGHICCLLDVRISR